MGPNVECPNPQCRKLFVVLDSTPFYCSNCGTHIEVAAGEAVYAKRLADVQAAKIRQDRLRKAKYLLVPLGLGLFLHEIGPYAIVLLVFAVGWLGITKLRRARLLWPKTLFAFVLLFVVGSIVGELLFPATAICSDGWISYSAHHSGTCSWHGGVSEWDPGPWWSR